MPSMSKPIGRSSTLDRQVRDRLRRVERSIGQDLERLRLDAAATRSSVAAAAGVDRTFYGRIETGDAHPSLETLVALSIALGAEPSVRLFAGTGPRLTDRHQARMVEAVLRDLAPVWRTHLEVPVWKPSRGVIDAVLERSSPDLLVLTEFQSTLARLEQQLRWMAEKAASIGSSTLVGDRPVPPTSRLLVLRTTDAIRTLARQFEATLATAYPARCADAIRALRTGSPWPGDAIIWVRLDGEVVRLLDTPPRGVALGR
jgi:transcriptional regulator with XRE-family HTH domain